MWVETDWKSHGIRLSVVFRRLGSVRRGFEPPPVVATAALDRSPANCYQAIAKPL
ncbi:MAG: hypothetical protein ACRC8Y_05605 [Chroococcales cyanobacterium]